MGKGSQHLIRHWINNETKQFNHMILSNSLSLLQFGTEVEWVSPIEADQFREYQDDFLDFITEPDERQYVYQKLREFWPSKGPVWDGIGIVRNGNQKGLILLEAKAHTGETKSAMKAKSLDSREKIAARIVEVKAAFGSNSAVEVWLNQYYQLANRLCFLYFLNEKLHIPTWLVLCNFIDDQTYKPTSIEKWLHHTQHVFNHLQIDANSPLMSKVITIYPK